MRIISVVVGLASLLVVVGGCSSAEHCSADDRCDGYEWYPEVLTVECSQTCSWLESCDLTEEALGAAPATCVPRCTTPQRFDQYWRCEWAYRRYLSCIQELTACDQLAACDAYTTAYNECLIPSLPGNADSCVHANNGVCDEPTLCVTGSDTTDCR